MPWLLMQLADSAFPTGGFAHSGGFEAALQLGEIQGVVGLEKFLSEALWQTGYGLLPLASAAHENSMGFVELDELSDAFLTGHVANRASRVQGRTFFSTCLRSFGVGGNKKLESMDETVRSMSLHQHFAPVFGSVMNALEVDRVSMQRLMLHGSFRTILSAAIRLGVVGPYQAQQVQSRFLGTFNEVLTECGELEVRDMAQTAPLLELFQSTHDRLYSKLFQS